MNTDDIGPQGLPDEYFAQEDIYDEKGKLIAREGDLFLSQVGGEKARNYFGHFGIPFPSGQGGDTVSKIRDESDISRQIREAYGVRK